MGLFGFNYAKPGPGVDANEPEKKGFFRFWEIIFEKFGKLLGLNTIHAILSIVYLVILFVIAPVSDTWLTQLAQDASKDPEAVQMIAFTFTTMMRAIFAVGIFMLWGSGPSSAAYAYISRCFVRRDPVWIISDGKDKIKENFKQSIIVAVIDIAVLFLSFNAMLFYNGMFTRSGNIFFMMLTSLMVMMFIVYTWMHFYIYQLMVTFECSLKQLYKNALIFAVAALPMNLFLTILALVVLASLFFFLNPFFAVIIDLILLPMLMRFPIEFYAARKIKKVAIGDDEKPAIQHEYFPEPEEEIK